MDPWSTHLPLLRTLGPGIRSVLELGAGVYSTPVFLDQALYPDVVRVDSVEHDREWAERVLAACPDPRLALYVVPEPIEDFLVLLPLDEYDLILVDNSDKAERRVATIQWIARHANRQLVVLHDLERDDYREAAGGFRHLTIHKDFVPWTGVARNA